MENNKQNIIIYKTADGKASVALYAKDGNIWMNQNQLAELFATSVPNISMHISNILKDGELEKNSVIKDYLTTAADGKEYNVTFYSLDMTLAIGFRVRSKRGTQFRIWANKNLKFTENNRQLSIKEFWKNGDSYAEEIRYPVSGMFVEDLIKKFGRDKFIKFFNDQTYENAKSVFGNDLDNLIAEFENKFNG